MCRRTTAAFDVCEKMHCVLVSCIQIVASVPAAPDVFAKETDHESVCCQPDRLAPRGPAVVADQSAEVHKRVSTRGLTNKVAK